MNDKLEGKLVEILDAIQNAAKAGGDFALQQLPDIAQSYVLYGRIYITVHVLITLGLMCISLWVAVRYGFKHTEAIDSRGEWTEGRSMRAVFGSIVSGVLFTITIINLEGLFLVWLAPKVWLLKELAGMVK